jgi:glycosyltransferase involved in cell wall biosynthesis
MNVLHVNYADALGARFNGADLGKWLRSNGHHSTQIVQRKDYPGSTSIKLPFSSGRIGKALLAKIQKLEAITGLDNALSLQSLFMLSMPQFWKADIVHYHIIHNHFFSYLSFPLLTALKPAVWTLHDPWALAGHCIHPFECTGWLSGCSPCPHLSYPFALKRDLAWLNFRLKEFTYNHSSLEIIVASHWMKHRVEKSPLLGGFPIHRIPFGLDLREFTPEDASKNRLRLGIRPDEIVVGLRVVPGPFKGLEYSIEALKALPPELNLHILTCQETGFLNSLSGRHRVTELGELLSEREMISFFQTLDIHLMPSLAESFGMMAMEAAACGIPSIVFTGTPLEEICFAPHGGIAVDKHDVYALARAINALATNLDRRREMGKVAREHAVKYYDFQDYAKGTLAIYERILSH